MNKVTSVTSFYHRVLKKRLNVVACCDDYNSQNYTLSLKWRRIIIIMLLIPLLLSEWYNLLFRSEAPLQETLSVCLSFCRSVGYPTNNLQLTLFHRVIWPLLRTIYVDLNINAQFPPLPWQKWQKWHKWHKWQNDKKWHK